MIYQFRPGSRVSAKLDPQACGAFIAGLASRAPRDIVEASRASHAPTHGHFTWKLSANEARMRVWEQEAGHLVRSLVVREDDRPDAQALPAFVSIVVRDSDDRKYLPTYTALADEDYRTQVLEQAKADLFAWRRRYHDLQELAHVFEAIDQLQLRLLAA